MSRWSYHLDKGRGRRGWGHLYPGVDCVPPSLLLPGARSYLEQHPQPQQALLLGCHHKVVSIILVIYDVLQVNPCGTKQRPGGESSSESAEKTSLNTQSRADLRAEVTA